MNSLIKTVVLEVKESNLRVEDDFRADPLWVNHRCLDWMAVVLGIGQLLIPPTIVPMTICRSSLHNVHLRAVQAERGWKVLSSCYNLETLLSLLTDMYERVPINVWSVESINWALTPKSHNFISPKFHPNAIFAFPLDNDWSTLMIDKNVRRFDI